MWKQKREKVLPKLFPAAILQHNCTFQVFAEDIFLACSLTQLDISKQGLSPITHLFWNKLTWTYFLFSQYGVDFYVAGHVHSFGKSEVQIKIIKSFLVTFFMLVCDCWAAFWIGIDLIFKRFKSTFSRRKNMVRVFIPKVNIAKHSLLNLVIFWQNSHTCAPKSELRSCFCECVEAWMSKSDENERKCTAAKSQTMLHNSEDSSSCRAALESSGYNCEVSGLGFKA